MSDDNVFPLVALGVLAGLVYLWSRSQNSSLYPSFAIGPLPDTLSPDGYSTATGQPVSVYYGQAQTSVPVQEPIFDWNTIAQSIPLNPVAIGNPAFASPSLFATSQQQRMNIEGFEGWNRSAYQDTKGNWTIGVGHKIIPGDGLSPQSVLTDGQVGQLFASDLGQAEYYVKSVVTVPVTQSMFDALVDFVFNHGIGTLTNSTLLHLLNSGDYQGAANEFPKWQPYARTTQDQQIFIT